MTGLLNGAAMLRENLMVNNLPYAERPEGVVLSLSKGFPEKPLLADQTFGTVRNISE